MRAAVVIGVLFCALVSSRTTLEKAVVAAFTERVADGSWSYFFGEDEASSGLLPSDLCSGPTSYWPKETLYSDLLNALGHGELICAQYAGSVLVNTKGHVLLDTRNGVAKGPVVQFWKRIADSIAHHYSTSFIINWKLGPSYQETGNNLLATSDILNGVLSGEYDAACSGFSAGGTFLNANGTLLSIASSFSTMCPTYVQEVKIWTYNRISSIDTFARLIAAISNNPTYRVCVQGSPHPNALLDSCTNTIRQYLDKSSATLRTYTCSASGDSSITPLYSGDCDASWGGASPVQGQRRNYHSFNSPILRAASTLFRQDDLSSSA